MNNQTIITEAAYNYLVTLSPEELTPKQQDDMKAFKASLVPAPEAPEEQPQPPEAWSVDSVAADPKIAEQFVESIKIVENQLPAFKDDKHKKLLVLAAKAICLTKWTGIFTLPIRTSVNGDLNHRLAHTFGLLSFDYYYSKSVVNKALKEAQIATKYLPICVVPEEVQRDTAVDGYNEVKKGCMLIAHWNTLKRDENDHSILGQFEHIFQDEVVKNDAYHTATTAIMGVRFNQQMWLESNQTVIVNLIEKLQTVRPAHVKEATFKAWSGILALALLWDKATYEEMSKLMVEMVGTEPLLGKYKLACALSVIVPDMEAFLNRYGNNDEMKLSNTMIGGLLKSVGFAEDLSACFADMGLPLKDHKSGYTVKSLKDTYTELLNFEDARIQNYFNRLNRPEAANTPEQKVA